MTFTKDRDDDYLLSPINRDNLLEKLANLVSSGAEDQNHPIMFFNDEYEIDFNSLLMFMGSCQSDEFWLRDRKVPDYTAAQQEYLLEIYPISHGGLSFQNKMRQKSDEIYALKNSKTTPATFTPLFTISGKTNRYTFRASAATDTLLLLLFEDLIHINTLSILGKKCPENNDAKRAHDDFSKNKISVLSIEPGGPNSKTPFALRWLAFHLRFHRSLDRAELGCTNLI